MPKYRNRENCSPSCWRKCFNLFSPCSQLHCGLYCHTCCMHPVYVVSVCLSRESTRDLCETKDRLKWRPMQGIMLMEVQNSPIHEKGIFWEDMCSPFYNVSVSAAAAEWICHLDGVTRRCDADFRQITLHMSYYDGFSCNHVLLSIGWLI